MTTEATPQTVTVRRATSQDVEALLPLAAKFVEMSPFGGMVPLHDESARSALLRCLVSGVGGATVFVAEESVPLTEPGREHETGTKIVGAVMGQSRTVWHSTQPIVEMLGGFTENLYARAPLLDAFRVWARKAQHASCVLIDGDAEKLR